MRLADCMRSQAKTAGGRRLATQQLIWTDLLRLIWLRLVMIATLPRVHRHLSNGQNQASACRRHSQSPEDYHYGGLGQFALDALTDPRYTIWPTRAEFLPNPWSRP
jgi:hypothetical protein